MQILNSKPPIPTGSKRINKNDKYLPLQARDKVYTGFKGNLELMNRYARSKDERRRATPQIQENVQRCLSGLTQNLASKNHYNYKAYRTLNIEGAANQAPGAAFGRKYSREEPALQSLITSSHLASTVSFKNEYLAQTLPKNNSRLLPLSPSEPLVNIQTSEDTFREKLVASNSNQ